MRGAHVFRGWCLVGSSVVLAVVLVGMLLVEGRRAAGDTAGGVRYVAPGGSDGGNDCSEPATPCATLQHAVDQSQAGDEIRMAAGTYTGVQSRNGLVQLAYIDKSVTVRGGYSTADWNNSFPLSQTTTLDAQGSGRVLVITNTITATIENLHITNGDASGQGSPLGLGDAGGGVFVYTATVRIDNVVFSENLASSTDLGTGGGLFLWSSDNTTLSSNTFTGNTASNGDAGYGGAVFLSNSPNAVLRGNTFSGNTASKGGGGLGGGVYLTGNSDNAQIRDNTFSGNTAGSAGGGSGGGLSLVFSDNAMLTGNIFTGNTASSGGLGYGGGLYIAAGSDNAQIRNNIFTNNVASNANDGRGGGLYLGGNANAMLSGNTISGNTASTAALGWGGGLLLDANTNTTMSGNTISGNTASTTDDGAGGGIYLFGNSGSVISGTTIISNTASSGGPGWGGGIYLFDSDTNTLVDNTVQNNIASIVGNGVAGGIGIVTNSDNTSIIGNIVLSNTATQNQSAGGWGGGVYIFESTAFTLTNNIIARNHANTLGDGVGVESPPVPISGQLLHNTIADNDLTLPGVGPGSGEGVYVGDNVTLSFTNTVLAGHRVGITVTVGSTVTLAATLWDNAADTGGGGSITTGNDRFGDPAFVDPAGGDYHLSADSAAIDAGVEGGVTRDLDGDLRPAGSGYDLGADEFVPGGRLYLPLVVR